MPETAREVRDLRLKLQLTQEDLAALLGTSWTSIHRWESGVHTPSFPTIALLRLMAESRDIRARVAQM